MSQPLVSCLRGCVESVNPPISRTFRGLCPLDQRETQAHHKFCFRFFLLLLNDTTVYHLIDILVSLFEKLNVIMICNVFYFLL